MTSFLYLQRKIGKISDTAILKQRHDISGNEPSTACKPYGESRKARNRNTNPPSGVGVKKRPIPSTATITEAIVRKKAQRSKRNQHRAVSRARTRAKGAAITFNIIFIVETSFLSFYLYFTMPARGHKCCE